MELLCPDLIDKIVSFIDDVEVLNNIIFVNKYYLINYRDVFKTSLRQFLLYIDLTYPNFIVSLFSEKKNRLMLRDLPFLRFKDDYVSPTGSINNIPLYDVQHPIMYSIDNNNHGFLVFRLKMIIHNYYTDTYTNSKYVYTVIALYQNPNTYYTWCIGSVKPYYELVFRKIINTNMVNNLDIIFLKQLIDGERIYHNNCIVSI